MQLFDNQLRNRQFVQFIQSAMDCNKMIYSVQDFYEETPMPILTDQIKSKIQTEYDEEITKFYELLKKYLNNQEITDIELQKLSERQRDILQSISQKSKSKTKRPDQCQKLFYKRVFKYSENKYFKKRKNKRRIMSQFYHHHFDSVAEKIGKPITSFYHPNKKTKPGLVSSQRTFNLSYVRFLLKSESFRTDAKQYHKIFKQQCIKQRTRKMKTFISSLQKIMRRGNGDPHQILKYLQSSQCKIPWTLQEIHKASQMAYKQLEKLCQVQCLDPSQLMLNENEDDAMDQEEIDSDKQCEEQSFFNNDLELPELF